MRIFISFLILKVINVRVLIDLMPEFIDFVFFLGNVYLFFICFPSSWMGFNFACYASLEHLVDAITTGSGVNSAFLSSLEGLIQGVAILLDRSGQVIDVLGREGIASVGRST